MKKLMVYSHDTFGLGNIRRMLSICKYLIDSYGENIQTSDLLNSSFAFKIHWIFS